MKTNQPDYLYRYSVPLIGIPIIIYFFLSIMFIYNGSYSWDEGWYLAACQKVYQGEMLYRDFGYTQTPILPYLYGLILKIFGYNLLNARILTSMIGLLTFILTLRIAYRLGSLTTMIFTAWLISCSPFILYFFNNLTTHALTALFITLSIYFFLRPNTIPNRSLSLIFIVLSIGTRLTLLPAWIILILFLYIENKLTRNFYIPILLSILAGIIVFIPSYLANKENFMFYTLEYHLQFTRSIRKLFTSKMILLSYFEESNIPHFIVGVVLFLTYLKRNYWKSIGFNNWFLLIFIVGMGIFQLSLKRSATSYIVNIMPLFCLVLALGMNRLVHESKNMKLKYSFLIGLMIVLLLYIPYFSPKYFLNSRIYNGEKYSDLKYNREIALFVQNLIPPDSMILTLDTIIPIEAGRKLVPGSEMSIFAYYPEWSTDKSKRFHTLNREILFQYIQSTSIPLIIYSEGSFDGNYATGEHFESAESPLVESEIKKYYVLVKEYPKFVSPAPQGSLFVYLPKRNIDISTTDFKIP